MRMINSQEMQQVSGGCGGCLTRLLQIKLTKLTLLFSCKPIACTPAPTKPAKC